MPINGEWLHRFQYIIAMECNCAVRNDELNALEKTWTDLDEIMKSEISRTKRTLYTVTAILFKE